MKLIYSLLSKGFSGFYTLVKYYIWKLNLSPVLDIRVIENEKFKFVHYGDIAQVLYGLEHLVSSNKGFEYSTLKIYKSLLKDSNIILDIGANIGLFSLLAAKNIGKNGLIYAFEPIPKTYQTLLENLRINNIGSVVTSQLALSNFNGKVSFSIPDDIEKDNEGDAFNSIDLNGIPSENDANCILLDIFLQEKSIKQVDLIKIDIEGAEMLCFQGAKELLSSPNPPIIIMECAESLCNKFNYSVFDVLSYLSNFGYSFEQYEYNQWLAVPKHRQKMLVKELF